ncbi:26S proteasome regulatory subunit Rpn7 [Penicillium paradoxum]|uniref:26S proteasome regulatory subunit Rpn7 n=1 Tax=Penicillium paradoxum TaxID=176176 RepID=UPI0025499D27|nr:26S proteasome regulatory subunit Rpn7 [Penicillium paradoxum]KAJ5780810.1 26S proteasome regulatory subunit Rpn7 [Penicillium paradoxum]
MDTTLPDASGPSRADTNTATQEAVLADTKSRARVIVIVEGLDNTDMLLRTEAPKFDLDTYISNYTGRTRFDRLYLIGTCSPLLSTDALKAAIAEARAGRDVSRYERAVRALADVAPGDPEASLDSVWVQETQRYVSSQTERLEDELRGYKNNLIKESIRMAHEDLGNLHYETGDLAAASKAYSRMRDYCTTPNHITSMLFKMVNVSIERDDWISVLANVHRLRNSQSKPDDAAKNQAKITAASALSQMHQGLYLEAANSFLSIPPELGDNYNEIITANDVAVYGGLCALASMTRDELQKNVLENQTFRTFLELEPHIRRAIAFFCNFKFRHCLEILDAYRPDYLLDVYLQRHIPTLYRVIRTKSIQQYMIPFSRVTLDSMAKIFAPEVVGGEARPTDISSPFIQELASLIEGGVLNARIDLEKGLLVSNQIDLRAELQRSALESLREFNQEVHWRTLAVGFTQAGFEVGDTKGEVPMRSLRRGSR